MTKLWEAEHPYYINDGNYYNNGCHQCWNTWQEFESGWSDADLDLNWFVAWEWREGEDNGAGPYTGDDYYRNGILVLQIIGRRKSWLGSHEVSVCRADEPAVRAFLQRRWDYMRRMWAPFSSSSGDTHD